METKRSSEVHLHTTQLKQNGEETEEGAIIRVYSSGHGCTILKQEMKGEESFSLDLKRWALAEGKLVVILYNLLNKSCLKFLYNKTIGYALNYAK